MNKREKTDAFDPNGYATYDSLFGLPFNQAESDVWVLPVPWEVTVSYATGTAKAPMAIKEASWQVDLYDPHVKNAWKRGIYMLEIAEDLLNKNQVCRSLAESYLEGLFKGNPNADKLAQVNSACAAMVEWVEKQTNEALKQGKKLVLLGGDHSTSLGYLRTLAKKHNSFGILQIDAHADLREAYEGFTYSHASIMHNALTLDSVDALVQVGIRDYCERELSVINKDERIHAFFDRDIKQRSYEGTYWANACEAIIAKLPQKVYISFDIDGLDPKLCPNTGTPVAGGFEVEQIFFLFEKVVASGRNIIGIDLNEVGTSPDTNWDANVAARLLYRLCNLFS